jgi:membrane-bound lytic murein transglycosylase B
VIRIALLVVAALAAPAHAAGERPYATRPDVRAFIDEMVERHGFVEGELARLFSRVRRLEQTLDSVQPPSVQRPRSWEDYRAMFVNERRISAGVAFWRANRAALERAQARFGVPAQYVVAIIGVETFYGRNTGRWRVIDALSTLAFDYPPRAPYFREELANFLLLARDEGIDVFSVRGSYAGAIGIPQFMPGSMRRFALDFDGSGAIDLQRSPADAIGSVANFLREHGWQPGGEVAFPVRLTGEAWRPYADGSIEAKHPVQALLQAGVLPIGLPEALNAERAALVELETPGQPSEYRIGLQNFYAITRYNRSSFYAAAVADLAAAIANTYEPGR